MTKRVDVVRSISFVVILPLLQAADQKVRHKNCKITRILYEAFPVSGPSCVITVMILKEGTVVEVDIHLLGECPKCITTIGT